MSLDAVLKSVSRWSNSIWKWLKQRPKRSISSLMLIAHLLGAYTAVRVIMEHRSPQGATAWAGALVTIPYVAVPAYWFFGKSDFNGYKSARESADDSFDHIYEEWLGSLPEEDLSAEDIDDRFAVLEKLVGMPFTKGNNVELLVDGEESFKAVFETLESAKDYILVQYYTIEDDQLGRKLQQRLIAKAEMGINVYVLYDEVGSSGLGSSYLKPLKDAGVVIRPFSSNIDDVVDFRLNFRNHRKMIVADGLVAVSGGCNVGDAYMGRDPDFGHWRDTNVRVRGPIVQALQVAFAEDWRWVTQKKLQGLCWTCPRDSGGEVRALCLPMGPAGKLETCALFHHAMIAAAKKRLWIASPYFVPDMPIVTGLQLAALRGVDVRILIPDETDSTLVNLSMHTYFQTMEEAGVKVYRYQKGFLHQKVVLVDDDFASVGTANFDNRSFHLNFEVNVAVQDKDFASKVAAMLEEDLDHCIPVSAKTFQEKGFFFRFAAHVSRLLAPIQ